MSAFLRTDGNNPFLWRLRGEWGAHVSCWGLQFLLFYSFVTRGPMSNQDEWEKNQTQMKTPPKKNIAKKCLCGASYAMPENVLVHWRLPCCLVNWLFCQLEMNSRKKDQLPELQGLPPNSSRLLGFHAQHKILSSQGKRCLTQMTEMHRKRKPHQ